MSFSVNSFSNLRPLWPSYQSHNMYCVHKSGEVCAQFQEKNSYTFYLATLGATYILHWSQFNEACTQFDEKPVVHLPQ